MNAALFAQIPPPQELSLAVEIVSWLLTGAAVYAGFGVLFAVAFVCLGVKRIDPAAAAPPVGFRLLLIPGSIALWPVLLRRWLLGSQPPTENNAHRAAAQAPAAKR